MRLSAPIYKLKRRAKLMARETATPLHAALDAVAAAEGYRGWSHLSAAAPDRRPAAAVFGALRPGDLMLLGARPGHGKTLLGLDLARIAAAAGRRAMIFTLDYTEADVAARLQELGGGGAAPVIDASDDICAAHVIDRLGGGAGGFAVIDYLQLLDQKRAHPPLQDQMQALRRFARAEGAVIIVISQIARAFEASADPAPGLADVRLPNPLDLSIFDLTCFLHAGEIRLDRAA